jgi:hypothetical protein
MAYMCQPVRRHAAVSLARASVACQAESRLQRPAHLKINQDLPIRLHQHGVTVVDAAMRFSVDGQSAVLNRQMGAAYRHVNVS